MYNRIKNPLTNRYVKTNSKLGKKIINSYLGELSASKKGGMESEDSLSEEKIVELMIDYDYGKHPTLSHLSEYNAPEDFIVRDLLRNLSKDKKTAELKDLSLYKQAEQKLANLMEDGIGFEEDISGIIIDNINPRTGKAHYVDDNIYTDAPEW